MGSLGREAHMAASQQQDRVDAYGGCSHDSAESTPAPAVVSSAALFAAYHTRIRRYILSIVRDATEADDLTQEVFLRAHRRLGSLRTDDAALPWLYRIATNVCYDRFRQRSRMPQLDGRDVSDAPAASSPDTSEEAAPDRIVARSEMSSCVQQYIEDLSDDYRQVILLHDVQNLTSAEIAAVVGVSVDAVKIRLHRARRKLQGILRERCDFSHDDHNVLVCDPSAPQLPLVRSSIAEHP
jgi:RNA polymerase sigma-70 factor, ECF subfamily